MDGERFTSNRKRYRPTIPRNRSQMTQAKTIGIALSRERPYIISQTRSFNSGDGCPVITFRFMAEICVYPGTYLDDIWFLLSLGWRLPNHLTMAACFGFSKDWYSYLPENIQRSQDELFIFVRSIKDSQHACCKTLRTCITCIRNWHYNVFWMHVYITFVNETNQNMFCHML